MQQSTSTELENAEEVVIFTTLKSRLPSQLRQLQPGAYLGGGYCAMAHPFGVPVIHKYLRIVRKIESCPSPSPSTFSRKSGQKNGLNLSEDLFLLIFIILKFPAPPPPFENPAYATWSQLIGANQSHPTTQVFLRPKYVTWQKVGEMAATIGWLSKVLKYLMISVVKSEQLNKYILDLITVLVLHGSNWNTDWEKTTNKCVNGSCTETVRT